MAPPLPSVTEPAGISVLPVPTLVLSKVWVKMRCPGGERAGGDGRRRRRAGGGVVDLGVRRRAVTVIARAVITPVVLLTKVIA